MTAKFDRNTAIAALIALGVPLAACGGSSGEGADAYLTIEGSSSVLLPFNGTSRLAVRYHDADNEPLEGKIDFEIVGNAGGGRLSSTSADADYDGIGEISVTAAAAEVSFRVRAVADGAAPVEWIVNVNASGTLDVTGTYSLKSRFDIVSGMPGAVGDVLNIFIDLTDDPYDPASYILDQIGGTAGDVIDNLRPAIDIIANEAILRNAPKVVETLIDVGDRFGQAARRLGIESTLQVRANAVTAGEGSIWEATHTFDEYGFEIDGEMYMYEATELGAEPTVVEDIAVSLDGERFQLGEHTTPLRYGTLLVLALQDVIIPAVSTTGASTLQELLSDEIDCAEVGEDLADYTDFGNPSLYEGACEVAIQAIVNMVLKKLADIDELAPVNFQMSGRARTVDNDGDLRADSLGGGKWTGKIDYNGDFVDMPSGSTFTGERR
jgi:hypothetical protein